VNGSAWPVALLAGEAKRTLCAPRCGRRGALLWIRPEPLPGAAGSAMAVTRRPGGFTVRSRDVGGVASGSNGLAVIG